jgi:hypothetical protein
LSWFQSIFARGRTTFWTLFAVLVGPPFLLLVILIAGLVTDTKIQIDAALVVLSVAAVLLATGVVHWLRHLTRPRVTVNVGYTMKLEQPAVPLGRYTFRLRIHYEVEQRGQRHVLQQAAVEMKFKSRDHPDLLTWCSTQVAEHLEHHRATAQQLHPESTVVVSPPLRPGEIEAEGGPTVRRPKPEL